MKKHLKLIMAIVLSAICLSSCLPISFNDNYVLYGSEWSDENEEEGLKFFKDDTVLFFSPYCRENSSYEYDKASGKIVFGEFIVSFPSFTGEITYAVIENEVMYMIWHKVGQSEECYATYYKRR